MSSPGQLFIDITTKGEESTWFLKVSSGFIRKSQLKVGNLPTFKMSFSPLSPVFK